MMRLELNNSGAWKLVIREMRPEHLPEVRAACLALDLASADRQITWRLVDDADTKRHPQGRVVARTSGHGVAAKWIDDE